MLAPSPSPGGLARPASRCVDLTCRFGLAAAAAMLTLPFLLPYHNFPLLTFYSEWLAFALGTLAAVALATGERGEAVRVPYLSAGFAAFALVLALQIALGRIAYPERSLIGMGYASWAAAIAWLGLSLRARCGEERAAHWIQVALVASGFIEAMSGFVQYYRLVTVFGYFGDTGYGADQGMFGTVAQRNNFANYLGCALVSLVFLVGRRRASLATALLIVLPLSLALALSASRSAWLFVGIAFIAALWAWRRGALPRGRAAFGFALVALALFLDFNALVEYTPWFQPPAGLPLTAAERLEEFFALGRADVGTGIRLYLFREAWRMFAGAPLLGVGFGEFAWRLFTQGGSYDGLHSVMDRHSHNALLQLLAETGAAGTACIVVPLLAWIARFPWRAPSAERIWIAAVLAIEGAHSMVEFPLWQAQFLGLAVLLLGMGSEGGLALRFSRMRQVVLVVLVVAAEAALVRVREDYRRLESWYLGIAATARAHALLSAAQLAPLTRAEEGTLFAPYYDLLGAELIEIDRDHLPDKLALNSRAMHLVPIPTAVFRQALLLELAGDRAGALRFLGRLRTIYPDKAGEYFARLDRLARQDPGTFGALARQARQGGLEG